MMDSSNLDQVDKSSPEIFSDSSLSPESPDSNDIFGEPLVHPRVGDEYQVEIPSLRTNSELFWLMMNPMDSVGTIDSSHSFLMGLPLPVMWVRNKAALIKDSTKPLNNSHAVCTNGVMESEKKAGTSQVSSVTEEPNDKIDAPNQTYCIVPGQSSDSLSAFEADCFLLGLYVFGKNLLEVMRFMESKGLGKILAYYYGRFYRSNAYQRWSECRKMRNRKCVLGHRFFTVYRQQELFVRLAPRLSEESRTKFLEVSKAFTEGRTSLDEYVSSLKAMVGIQALVEAVGIGKGKEDLTTLIFDGSKNNPMLTHRPEIPSGKACSSLTYAEIVKYLTGDFRLSKARSNDLFWEAVWPRLLARGWHSEQPRGDGYAGSRHSLVFLIPGIKKFSRRKLSKGDHYFDCVSDVLAKVASEPELLVLETDEAGPSISKVENGWPLEVKSEDGDQDSSDHERHCYLKPRVSSEVSNFFKFTVVDTSLANEDNPFKVRELRSLPHEAKRCSFRKTDILNQLNGISVVSDAINRMPGKHGISYLEPLKKPADGYLLTDQKSRTIKHQFSRRVKPGPTGCSVSGPKRRRLASCVEAEVTCVLSLPARIHHKKKGAVPSRVSQSDKAKAVSSEHVVSCTPDEKIPSENCIAHESSDISRENEKIPRKQQVFDLNLPQVPSEPENDSDGQVKPEVGKYDASFQPPDSEKQEERSVPENPLVSSAPAGPVSAAVGSTDKSGDVMDLQPRRQSTRNRPLTTKALEALEVGFLSPVRHGRKRSPSTTQDKKPKRSRQPRNNVLLPGPHDLLGLPAAANDNTDETLSIAISSQNAGLSTREMLVHPENSFSQGASSKEMIT